MKRHFHIITTCTICLTESILYGFLNASVITNAKLGSCQYVTVTTCRPEDQVTEVRIPARTETCPFTSDLKPNRPLPFGDWGNSFPGDTAVGM
jgi:hypothetical protein